MEPQFVSRGDHLFERKGVLYYRRRVPQAALGVLKRKEITRSLNTSSLAEAKRLRNQLDAEYDHLFEEAKGCQADGVVEKLHLDPTPQQCDLVSAHLAQLRENRRREYFADPPASAPEQREMAESAGLRIDMLKNRDDPGHLQYVDRFIRQSFGASVPALLENVTLGEVVRRGLLSAEQEHLARIEDRADFTGPAPLASVTTTVLSFASAAAEFLQLTATRATANSTSKKWVDKQAAHIELLLEIIGPDTPIARVD